MNGVLLWTACNACASVAATLVGVADDLGSRRATARAMAVEPLCASITPSGVVRVLVFWLAAVGLAAGVHADDAVDAAAVLGPNHADEPVADAFSMDAAVDFLDHAALTWTRERKCFTCHTNFLYLMAKPAVAVADPAHAEVRGALESLVRERWVDAGPRWDAEVVMAAATLAVDDRLTTGTLDEVTRVALDRMWTVQREDGGTSWLKCGWPPMESDDDYGVAVLALAAGAAPENYQQTATARAGLDRIRKYLAVNPPPTLHHEAMLMWADSYLEDDLLSEEGRKETVDALFSLQKEDGGWSAATLGDWTRADGGTQDTEHSDGYGTAFVTYVLRRSGTADDDPRIERGQAWLRTHQRVSGRWFARSLNRDNAHFLSHAASAFAVLALADDRP